MFWNKNKKNRYTPTYPSFTLLKWGIRGYSLHRHVFLMTDEDYYCLGNFGNEFVFTPLKDYLYYLDRSPLSQIFEYTLSTQN